jgi:hypothetical protein
MLDHLHLFVATDDEKVTLPAWMKPLKNTISKALRMKELLRHIGKRHFSIICFGVVSSTSKSGATFRENPVRAPEWSK